VTEPKIIPAIKGTQPRYSHLEAEELMEIILKSGHPRAEYLAAKLVTSSGNPIAYAATLARVRASVILNSEGHINGEPIPAPLLQELVLAQFPEAADFELAGYHGRYRCEGLTFRAGKRWRFAAPNGYVSKIEYETRSSATDAFGDYMRENDSQTKGS
jgi:hypothetical protein